MPSEHVHSSDDVVSRSIWLMRHIINRIDVKGLAPAVYIGILNDLDSEASTITSLAPPDSPEYVAATRLRSLLKEVRRLYQNASAEYDRVTTKQFELLRSAIGALTNARKATLTARTRKVAVTLEAVLAGRKQHGL